MNSYVEAPTTWVGTGPSIFLAGSITGAPDWQKHATELLRSRARWEGGANAWPIILNPRRKDFDVRDPAASDVQVEWEFDHIARASVVLFWFPEYGPNGVAPITLYELGRTAALVRNIAVGVEPGFAREFDVRKQLSLARPDVHVYGTLAATCATAYRMAMGR